MRVRLDRHDGPEAAPDLVFSLGYECHESTVYQDISMEFRSRRGRICTALYDIYAFYEDEGHYDPPGDRYRGHFSGSKQLQASVVINTEGWLDA